MPANRLRNQDWRGSLKQINERGGSLDVAIAPEFRESPGRGHDVLWRVRLLEVADASLTIEQPSTLGKSIDLDPGIELVVIMTIGQNRWMFRTTILEQITLGHGGGRNGNRPVGGLRIANPDNVERCHRRSNYRISTTELNLPEVDIWPLLDPQTVVLAERANEIQASGEATPDELSLPDVGPKFQARLLNLGGGGVGLTVPNDQSQHLLNHKLFWLRIPLPGSLAAPICATAKLVHTHMTASQDYYSGLAFDFTFNPAHQKHVIAQIGQYVEDRQRVQQLRKSA